MIPRSIKLSPINKSHKVGLRCVCGFCFNSSVNSTLGSFVTLVQAVRSIPQISTDYFYNFLKFWKYSHLALGWNWTLRGEEKGEVVSQRATASGLYPGCGGPGAEHHQSGKELNPFYVLCESPASISRWFLFCLLKYSLL